jgi:Helix-turn-helix domain
MTQSHKTQWQKALAKSGLGHRAICTGLVMSLYADADGSRMWPSMRTLAREMRCDKKYVTEGRATLAEYGWVVFVAKGVPGQKGDEFLPTFGRRHESFSEGDRSFSRTPEAVEIGPSQEGDRSVSEGDRSVSEARQVPERVITMRSTMSLNHERHHGPTGSVWDGPFDKLPYEVKAEARAAAEAKAIADAPDF